MAGTGGGPEKTILRSPKYADQSRYQMAAAYLHPTGDVGVEDIREQAQTLGCPFYSFDETGATDLRPLRGMLELCKKLNVTIWHGHDYKSNLYGLMLRKFWPMKLVSTAHLWTDDTLRMRLYRKVDEWCLPRYDEVIAVSTPIAEHCAHVGVARNKLTMIPNAIEAQHWQRSRSTAQAKTDVGIDANTLTVGVTGRLNIQKRIDRLLWTVAQMRSTLSRPLCVMLVGDGEERKALTQQANALGIADMVRFCGWQSTPMPWYEAMDLFVLPSRDEGLPNAVLEAMAMQVPVAATDVGGVADLLDQGRCGVLLEQSPEAWPALLTELLEDEPRRQALATTARQRIETHFTFETRMQRVMEIYDRVLAAETVGYRRAA